MALLAFVVSQIKEIEEARQKRLEQEPETEPHAMVRLLARVVLNAEGWPRRSRRILSSFSSRSIAFLLYDSVAMRGFVGSDLGREPVPDLLMVAM